MKPLKKRMLACLLACLLLLAAGCGGGTDAPAERHVCTLSIDCASLVGRTDLLRDPETAALLPEDGWILPAGEVEFTPGDSAYDVLARACRQSGIQMEAAYTPLYGSYYLEGIGNLYEFDAGVLSGWVYSVNGEFPNYACSSCTVCDGDVICFRYTCDMGEDVGGNNAAGTFSE